MDMSDAMRRCLLELQFVNNTNGTNQKFNACDDSLSDKLEEYVTPLWESDFPLTLFYCFLTGLVWIVGAFGNIIILIVNVTKRTANKIGRAFIVNLALSDLCVTGLAAPMCIIGVLKGELWLQQRWWLCELVASLCFTACFCAFLSLTMMIVNRYVYVCHHNMFDRIFNRCSCLLLCLGSWVLGFIFDFPNFVGWGDHFFDKKSHQCHWSRTASLSYTLLVSIGLIASPLFIMAVCFVLIFIKIWRSKMNVHSLNKDDPLRMRRVWTESFRASRTLAITFVVFVICWTPYAVIIAVDVSDEFPMELHLFVTLLAHAHSSFNFIIYMASNKNFRQSVNHLPCCAMVPPLKCMSLMKIARTSDSSKSKHATKNGITSVNSKRLYYINVEKSPIDGGLTDEKENPVKLCKLPDSLQEDNNQSDISK